MTYQSLGEDYKSHLLQECCPLFKNIGVQMAQNTSNNILRKIMKEVTLHENKSNKLQEEKEKNNKIEIFRIEQAVRRLKKINKMKEKKVKEETDDFLSCVRRSPEMKDWNGCLQKLQNVMKEERRNTEQFIEMEKIL